MDPFTIIIIAAAIWFLFIRKKPEQGKSSEGADTSNMTETQRNWHNFRQTAAEKTTDPALQNVQRINEAHEFIRAHMRPFTIMGWLFDPIHPSIGLRLLPTYLMMYGLPIVIFIWGPAIFGTTISLIWFAPIAFVADYVYYRQSRMNEVIYDNPEFQEKYGDLVQTTK
jgi:hypothetical protein